MQGEGMSLSADEKLRLVHKLDELGVHLIEAGFPGSNPKELELFETLATETLSTAQIAAFGMTRRRDVSADADPGLRVLADCFAPVCTLVGKTWSLHLEKVVRVEPGENLRMIADSVGFLVAQGKRVIYDAEHFFDGWRADPAYAVACLRAAADAGAENVTLCDTNGASLPHQVADAMRHVRGELGDGVALGIHCHDDAGVGVANSLVGVPEGAVLVQGTMNGYGERCGNANLTTIVPNLQLKMGHDCLPSLEGLTEVAHMLDEMLNFTPNANQPYVGKNAFTHKGGLHVAGVNADPATFEHIDPGAVGNAREILMSELAGKGTVIAHAGGDLDDATAARVVERVKEREHRGFQFEAADGSLDLLIRRETGEYEPLFRLEAWRVIAEKREDGRVMTEATIKIWVEGERFVRVAEGNGPVHALDRALRDAISETYPPLADIKLVNYKVRILDEAKATAAVTRVLLDASDGHDTWGAIGVHENVIEASWDALVDSLEAGMLPNRVRHASDAAAAAAGARGMGPVEDEAIPMARPVLGPEEEQAVLEVLRSGQLSLGPRVPRFEEDFAARIGDGLHASAVSSGTAGLHLALRAAGVGEGDEVITSPFSFIASANSVLFERARPVFVDIDPVTLNITPQAAAAAVGDRTRALLPVDIFGYPVDIEGFEALGLPIVEDACEALGAGYADGTPVGSRAHSAVFAFYPNNQMTTGEGGIVVSGDSGAKVRIGPERTQGRAPNMGWLDHDRL